MFNGKMSIEAMVFFFDGTIGRYLAPTLELMEELIQINKPGVSYSIQEV